MKGPTSRRHRIDFWCPIVQLPFLGEPVEDVLAAIRADDWDVDLYDDSPTVPLGPNASVRERSRIVTLQVRYDYVPVAARGGRVVALGQNAPYYR